MKLFAAQPESLRPVAAGVYSDRVGEWVADGTPSRLRDDLCALLGPERVLARALDLVSYSSDASPYRLVPQVVVMAQDVGDIQKVLSYAARTGHHVTFRAAGTSLSGQSQGDDILVDVRRHWTGVEVLDGGRRVRCRPGTTIGRVNMALWRHGYQLGPDPASSAAATVGGVVANNASGMAAGVKYNSYNTVESLSFVLPSGTMINTADPDAETRFAQAEPALARGLMEIKESIEADPELVDRLRRKYAIKNTNGYRLDAYLDSDTSLQILRRLLVSSEGTLGFISEVVFQTVPLLKCRATAMLLFDSLQAAVEAVPRFVAAGAPVVELIDGASFGHAALYVPGAPVQWRDVPKDSAALLVEFRAADDASLDVVCQTATAVAADRPGLLPGDGFVRDDARIEMYWQMRKGLAAFSGMERASGTTLILEDVCVAPDRVAEAGRDVMDLQGKFGYLRNVNGHASAGNLHFTLTVDVADKQQRDRYAKFMDGIAELIATKFDGSLKAEHGTGRNIAPFLETEWGAKATGFMWRTKELVDPAGVLAPDVVLTRNPLLHLTNLCSEPTIEDVADRCIECGFCEPVCPSRDLTTTPRQRIILRREMARQSPHSRVQQALLDQYQYDAVETCAGDASCMIACPVNIDTGAMMKDFRHRQHGKRAERAALYVARHWAATERIARAAVRAGNTVSRVFGDRPMTAVTSALRAVIDRDLMPAWTPTMPQAAARLPQTLPEDAHAVYFPACVNRIFGQAKGVSRSLSLPATLIEVSQRAGCPLWIPPDVKGGCCATVWHSKGYHDGTRYMAGEIVERLWRWSRHGQLPIVVDASSCTLGITEEIVPYLSAPDLAHLRAMTVYDSVTWAAEQLLPRLAVTRPSRSATVHATCSTRHLGVDQQLIDLAGALADEVHVPATDTCCGFAGDRGFLHNELTRSATAAESAQVRAKPTATYLCSNRMCEVGLQQTTEQPYESFVFLLEEATRPDG